MRTTRSEALYGARSEDLYEDRSLEALYRARSLKGSLRGQLTPRPSTRIANLRIKTRLAQSEALYEDRSLRDSLQGSPRGSVAQRLRGSLRGSSPVSFALRMLAPRLSTRLICSKALHRAIAPRVSSRLARSKALYSAGSEALHEAHSVSHLCRTCVTW